MSLATLAIADSNSGSEVARQPSRASGNSPPPYFSPPPLFVAPACAQKAERPSETAAGNPGQTPNQPTLNRAWNSGSGLILRLLARALGWLSAKHLGPLLSARSHEIHEGLAAGEKASAQADARAAAVQGAKIANLGDAISQIKISAREERDREAERIRRDGLPELARVEHQANQEIDSAGKVARLEFTQLRRFPRH